MRSVYENDSMTQPLILASTSVYRRQLLSRLRVPFDVVAPGVDETPLPGESPATLALRLAHAKAQAVAAAHPQAWVIGSDQVADLHGTALGKPGSHARAVEQMRLMRGHSVVFQTAVCVAHALEGFAKTERVAVHVRFRDLTDADIENYLRIEQPYDCAGSAKSEALGIALLDEIVSDDPTALVGLPLIRTCRLLRAAGFDVLSTAQHAATHG
jgi:septum formation protein